jgi:hypothetical protein
MQHPRNQGARPGCNIRGFKAPAQDATSADSRRPPRMQHPRIQAPAEDATSADSRRPPRMQHPRIQDWVWPWGGGRTFLGVEGTAGPPPTDGCHPRRGRNRRCRAHNDPRGSVPTRKMRPRAAGVDACGRAQMLSEVEQHVHHARSHLPRCGERTDVVAIANDLPLAAKDAIDGQRQPDGEPVHAATGSARLIPLDDEVPVVLLDGVVDHAESVDRCPADRPSERPEHAGRPERRKPGRCSDRDLKRVSRVDLRPRVVRHRRSASWLSPRPLSCTAPLACHLERQPQLPSSLRTSPRLDSAHVPFVGADGVGLRGSCGLDSADVSTEICRPNSPAETTGGVPAVTTMAPPSCSTAPTWSQTRTRSRQM